MRTGTRLLKGLATTALLAFSVGSNAVGPGTVFYLSGSTVMLAGIEYQNGGDLDWCGPPDSRLFLWWDRLDPTHREKFAIMHAAYLTRSPVFVSFSADLEDCRGPYNRATNVSLFSDFP